MRIVTSMSSNSNRDFVVTPQVKTLQHIRNGHKLHFDTYMGRYIMCARDDGLSSLEHTPLTGNS